VEKKIKEYMAYRRQTQDSSLPSAGCVFKNPGQGKAAKRAGPSAAYFIERCGLKGSYFGDAHVSLKHANFIVNNGQATFADIRKLILYITRQVKNRFNVNLEPEIRTWA
ncbi:MAG: UDP-N-acetylmuramate dehydrogenase, partial [Candidatus Omnitrophica bacterium]|nr:UDP-N-acetylmuramate dehydrogenase [Candidatus Omnitrophota bacterium]